MSEWPYLITATGPDGELVPVEFTKLGSIDYAVYADGTQTLEVWERSSDGEMELTAYEDTRAQVQRDVCQAFNVKPYLIGIGSPPWWYRPWLCVSRPVRRVLLYRKGWRYRDGRWVDIGEEES